MASLLNAVRTTGIDVVSSVGTIASALTTAVSALGYTAEQYKRTSSEANEIHKKNTGKRLVTLMETANTEFAKAKKARMDACVADGINYQEIEIQSEKEVSEILKALSQD